MDVAAESLADQVVEADRDDVQALGAAGLVDRIDGDTRDAGLDRLDPHAGVGLAFRENRDHARACKHSAALGEGLAVVDRAGVVAASADRHGAHRPEQGPEYRDSKQAVSSTEGDLTVLREAHQQRIDDRVGVGGGQDRRHSGIDVLEPRDLDVAIEAAQDPACDQAQGPIEKRGGRRARHPPTIHPRAGGCGRGQFRLHPGAHKWRMQRCDPLSLLSCSPSLAQR